jgi:hypothetical protein
VDLYPSGGFSNYYGEGVKEGSEVALRDNPSVSGTVSKMPSNSEKRKRPRVQVESGGVTMWFYLDELVEVQDESLR